MVSNKQVAALFEALTHIEAAEEALEIGNHAAGGKKKARAAVQRARRVITAAVRSELNGKGGGEDGESEAA